VVCAVARERTTDGASILLNFGISEANARRAE
jgi:hypothetical protein